MANLDNGSEPFDLWEEHKGGSRQWVFTVFTPTLPTEMAEHMTYVSANPENCPFTGRFHWQVYGQFSQNVKRTHIQKWVGVKCWAEPSIMSNAAAAKRYCQKMESRCPGMDFIEMGEFRGRGGKKADAEKVRTRTLQVLNHAEQIELNRANILPGEEQVWQHIKANVPWHVTVTEQTHWGVKLPVRVTLNGLDDDVASRIYETRMNNGERMNADKILEEIQRIRDA